MNEQISAARGQALLLTLLQGIVLLGVGNATLYSIYMEFHSGDLLYYYNASAPVLSGHLPYRDFGLAYPPLSLAAFLLPHLTRLFGQSGVYAYAWGFLGESLCWSTGIALLLWRLTTRRPFPLRPEMALTIYTLIVAVFSGLLPWRYDLFPALLTLLALVCLLEGRPLMAGGCLGLATAAKLYPIVLIPVFCLYLLASQQRRGAARLALGAAGAVALCLLPFVRVPAATLFSFLTFHAQRGLEVESLPAGIIMAAHALGWIAARPVLNYGAFHLDAPVAALTIPWLPVVFAGLYGVVLLSGWRSFREEFARAGRIAPETLVRCLMAALFAFLAANKVFSTSYVIWLLPFAPLLRLRDGVQILVLFGLTSAIYPYSFNLLLAMHPGALILLNARNAFLLALLFQFARPAAAFLPFALPSLRPSHIAEASR